MTNMSKEAMKLALEAFETLVRFESDSWELGSCRIAGRAISALREALASEAIEQPAQQEPVAIEYWLQDTMESGRWVTTDNMAKATAEKMLSGEYGDVYPQGRIVEPSPPAQRTWVSLTDEQINKAAEDEDNETAFLVGFYAGARFAEAAHGIKENT